MENKKILILGNGFNIAYSNKKEKYKDVLKRTQEIAWKIAYKYDLFDTSNGEPTFEKYNINIFAIKSGADKKEKRSWNYLVKQEQDSETLLSLTFLTEKFDSVTNKQKTVEEIKKLVNEDIEKYFEENELYSSSLDLEEFLRQKLESYDWILTTNYDKNIETLVDRSKVIHIHGVIGEGEIKVGPFANLEGITNKWKAVGDLKDATIDIFGLSMITEIHIMKWLVEDQPSKVNHYIYNFRENAEKENITYLVNNYLYGKDRHEIHRDLITSVIVRRTGIETNSGTSTKTKSSKIWSFNDNYKQKPSTKWLDTLGREEINTTFVTEDWNL